MKLNLLAPVCCCFVVVCDPMKALTELNVSKPLVSAFNTSIYFHSLSTQHLTDIHVCSTFKCVCVFVLRYYIELFIFSVCCWHRGAVVFRISVNEEDVVSRVGREFFFTTLTILHYY